MKTVINHSIRITGIIFVVLSAAFFYFPDTVWISHNRLEIFTVHYLLSALFTGVVLVDAIRCKGWRFYNLEKEYLFIILTLLTISAFGLNREISVFDESEKWLSIFIVAQCITFLIYPYLRKLPEFIGYMVFFTWGINVWVYLYFTFYLFPTYIFGMIGLIFFGITIHVFVPAMSLAAVLHELFRKRNYQNIIFTAGIGFVLAAGAIGFSAVKWNSVNQFFRTGFHNSLTDNQDELLPLWAKMAQNMPDDYFFMQYLKLDHIYVSDFLSFGSFNFQDEKRHDPLVNVLSHLIPTQHISTDNKLKILKTKEDLRHQAEDRLWSGRDLKTDHIIHRIELYPQYRIAYTELIMTIQNLNDYEFNQQEALYTFYLPEGAVATSLSLWIEGEEQKARLTTRHKADSAYTSIVSRRKDPSVVHWQEGNRLQVRVFPCTPTEERVFRIGITAPLMSGGGNLSYQPIYFKGPATANATEHIEVLDKSEKGNLLRASLETKEKSYTKDRKFTPGFTFSIKASPLSDLPFVYKGHAYHVEKDIINYAPANFDTLYLDLNKEWNKKELEQIRSLKYPVKVMDENSIIKMSEVSEDQLNEFLERKFSFIPFHLIEKPERALIITKGVNSGPFLKDIEGSPYLDQVIALGNEYPFKMYSLNSQISPYLKTLVAAQQIIFDKGTMEELKELIKAKIFLEESIEENSSSLPNAECKIVKIPAPAPGVGRQSSAPDHLVRMYNYQKLMKKMNVSYLFEDTPPEYLYKMAETAFTVTPFTSLIVLEQLSDYEQFDINKNRDTLGNATFNNSGAIPEPHEWLLIITIGVIVSVILFKRFL